MIDPLPILVSEHDDIPIYLQIAHQVTYLIYSERLPDGARLPTVRALAAQLQLHPNTITQAYAELGRSGLVAGQRGRGTYVQTHASAANSDLARRIELLRDELHRTRRRARALGFGDGELRAQLFAVTQSAPQACEAAFVAPGRNAAKYATALTAALADVGVHVVPLDLEDVQLDSPAAADVLGRAYHVITPVTLRLQLEELLAFRTTPHAVLPVALDLTPAATRRVAALPAETAVCVFTSPRYLAIALHILHTHGTAPFASLTRVLDTSPEAVVRTALAAADVVVHTIGVVDELDRYEVPAERRLELEFHASDESVARLRARFAARGAPATAEVR